jgi:hypothetical protein
LNRARVIAATAIAGLVLAAPARGAQRFSADDFEANIERARAIAVSGEARPSPSLMRRVAAELGLPADVELSWGVLPFDRDRVLESLSGDSSGDFARAVAHLDALRDELREAAAAKPRDPAQVRAAARRSFSGITASRSWIQIARERLREAFLSLFERIARATASGFGLIAAIIAALALVALAVALILMRLRVLPDRLVRRESAQAARPDWRVLAAEAEARGDLEAAVHAHYQILLEELARRGIVEDEPSLTAGECRSAVADARPHLLQVVTDATDAFERVAYGDVPPRAEHVERLRRASDAARAA